MHNVTDAAWVDARLSERAEERKQKRLKERDPSFEVIDGGEFAIQLAKLAQTITYCVEREGPNRLLNSSIPEDSSIILRQLTHTYDLILYINANERRENDPKYHQAYSFVVLPLVRTMIDGFYNCTAMLDDPRRARIFRISGLYRMRESIQEEEARYIQEPNWREYLKLRRKLFKMGMQEEGFTDMDLDNKINKWPLLGTYLDQKPNTPHKQMLRKLTLGFWKQYSSISHASYDGLLEIFPFIAGDAILAEKRSDIADAAERHITTHVGRAAALLLCLLTEIQSFFRFDGPEDADNRLAEIWAAMLLLSEAKELYDFRYRSLLKKPQA